MKYLLLPLLLLSCGGRDTTAALDIKSLLKKELIRVEPLLLTCYGTPAKARKNNKTGEPNCEVGDSVTDAGFATLYGRFDYKTGLYNSLSEDGRPWRNPSYRDVDLDNSFSRDQLLGIIEYTVSTKDTIPLKNIMTYVKRTGKLCPDANDNKCDMTQSMQVLVDLALGEDINVGEDLLDMATLAAEATGTDGYQAFLVGRKVMLHKILGREGYNVAANTLYHRFPNNAFFAMVAGDNKRASELILVCLRAFKEPGSVVASHYPSCPAITYGHDVVSVGRWLIR